MDSDELIKDINSLCVRAILAKKRECKCRVNSCFHAGQLDLALKILLKTGFDMSKIRKMYLSQPID